MAFSVLRFWLFFRSVFRFCAKRLRFFAFGVHCGLPIFSFFNIWISVFVEATSGFSVLLSDVRGFWVFLFCPIRGFARIFMRFSITFPSILRFLIYPNVPLSNVFYCQSIHIWNCVRLPLFCNNNQQETSEFLA